MQREGGWEPVGVVLLGVIACLFDFRMAVPLEL